MKNKCVIVGANSNFNLETSYKNSLEKLNYEIYNYNIAKYVTDSFPLSRFTQRFSLDNWQTIHTANIAFSKFIFNYRPNFILVFCNAPVSPGTLLFLKTLGVKCVLIWPDSIVNVNQRYIDNIALYDLIASHSSKSVQSFINLGSKKVIWIPLGADVQMHYINREPRVKFDYDFVFIGGWRPEREKAMSLIAENFRDKRILIQGSGWKRKSSDRSLNKFINEGDIYAGAYAEIISKGFINLNIIDETNFPSANMRFFEIPTAGAFQICSHCPEMEDIFKEGIHLLYYDDNQSLLEKIKFAFDNPIKVDEMRVAGQKLILAEHTYDHRVQSLVKYIESTE